jgi:hypothetical protein
MRKQIQILAALSLFAASISAMGAPSTSEWLAAMRRVYDGELIKISMGLGGESGLAAQYAAALKGLQKQKQDAGDLDGWQNVQTEIMRYGRQKMLAEADLVEAPAELLALQVKWRERLKEQKIEPSKRLVALAEKYTGKLKERQIGLTKAGMIPDAMLVNAEYKRVERSAGVAAARAAIKAFVADGGIADNGEEELEEAPEVVLHQPVVEPMEEEREEEIEPPMQEDSSLQTGCKIYRGKQPAGRPGVHYKRLATRATKASRLKRAVSAQVQQGISRGGEIETAYTFVALKASGEGVSSARVKIQFFVKSTDKRVKTITPTCQASFEVSVDQLKSEPVFIKCPPVVIGKDAKTTSATMYGVAVTISRPNGEMLHQSVFPAGLEGFVTTD